MSATSSVDPAVAFIADYFYKHLMGATRAKEVALYFYRKELQKQKATESDFRYVAFQYATHLVERRDELRKTKNSELTEEQLQELERESIAFSRDQYARKLRPAN